MSGDPAGSVPAKYAKRGEARTAGRGWGAMPAQIRPRKSAFLPTLLPLALMHRIFRTFHVEHWRLGGTGRFLRGRPVIVLLFVFPVVVLASGEY